MQNLIFTNGSLDDNEIKKITKFLLPLGYNVYSYDYDNYEIGIFVICLDTYNDEFSEIITKCKERYPDCRVIGITENRSFDLARECIRLNMDYVLLRPYTFDELKAAIKKCIQSGKSDVENKYSNLVNKAVMYINDNYNKGITLKEMAEDLNVSNWHLCKALKAETGKNFINIITGLRIDKAKVLLKETDMKVCEISSFLGISEITYFINMFKKHVGISPSVFREQEQKLKNG